MKKITMTIILIIIMIIALGCSKTFAADEKLTLESVDVSAPAAGIYGEGQEITIKLTFNKPIKGTMPKYSIYFGKNDTNKIELETEEITAFTSQVLYKYIIKSGDNGELKPYGFVNATEAQIEDEAGNKYYLTSSLMTSFETKILADTTISWTDFSNVKIKMVAEDGNHLVVDTKLEDVILKSNNDYYVHISHEKNEDIQIKHVSDIYDNMNDNGKKIWQTTLNTKLSEVYNSTRITNFFAEAGELYVTICEIDRDTNVPKIVLKSQKLERLKLLPLTQRITAYFFDDYTSTYCWEPYGEDERKINYKIGQVTDVNILKALKNSDSESLENLLKYAKESIAIASGTLKLEETPSITHDLNLVDDGYYFVYFAMDTENGKYMTIEDVNLYQAFTGETGNWLNNMTHKDFKWNFNEQETTTDESSKKEDSTIADFKQLPNTGITITIVVLIVIISTASIVYLKKYKLYKDIK